MSSYCKSCGAEIEWVKTSNGKSMPVDKIPSQDGNIMVRPSGVAEVLSQRDRRMVRTLLHTSHFASCPHAKQHRKEKR